MQKNPIDFMSIALDEARKAFFLNEVPVGAVIVQDGVCIAKGHNLVIADQSVSSHAEIIAIQLASIALKNYLYFGCSEPKSGAIESVDRFLNKDFLNHTTKFTGGICAQESAELLKKFFFDKRK